MKLKYFFGILMTLLLLAVIGVNAQVTADLDTTNAPHISLISPSSGTVGESITIIGTGFASTGSAGNRVNFGNGVIMNLPSNDGKTLQFNVPAYQELLCSFNQPPCQTLLPAAPVIPGNYQVYVTNNNGNSNKVKFTVEPSIKHHPSLTLLDPDITDDGIVNDKDVDLLTAAFGSKEGDANYDPMFDLRPDGFININDLSLISVNYGLTWPPTNLEEGKLLIFFVKGEDPDGDTLTFSTLSLPRGASLIEPTTPMPSAKRFDWTPSKGQAGKYSTIITVSDGRLKDSKLLQVTVVLVTTDPDTTNAPHISLISPSSGTVGERITIIGTGFTPTGNRVNFGNGIIMNLKSVEGRMIVFEVPEDRVPLCAFTQPRCMLPAPYNPVTSGNYQIYVTNNNGNSNEVKFTVEQAKDEKPICGNNICEIGEDSLVPIACTNSIPPSCTYEMKCPQDCGDKAIPKPSEEDKDIETFIVSSGSPLTLGEGESRIYVIDENKFLITVEFIGFESAKFNINGLITPRVPVGDKISFENGWSIGVSDVLVEEDASILRIAKFYLEEDSSIPIQPTIPTCTDGVKNDGEEGVDCGGPCKSCISTTESCNGCLRDSTCLPFGTRLVEDNVPKFCDITKNFVAQEEKEGICQNNYECKTNQCNDGVCGSLQEELRETRGLLQNILNWLRNIFG